MTRIILTRHGEVEGLDPERFRGRADVPLTARGRRQARLTGRRIAAEWKPVAIYTSPLQRAVETGKAIGVALGLQGEALPELNDIDYGVWQWRTFEAVRAESPVLFDLWLASPHLMCFPGGESLHDLVARTAEALRLLVGRHGHETIVVVGHDSVNRALLLSLLRQPLSAYWRLAQSPCGVSEILIETGAERVLRINETLHLLGAK